jgi:hypothetical protein
MNQELKKVSNLAAVCEHEYDTESEHAKSQFLTLRCGGIHRRTTIIGDKVLPNTGKIGGSPPSAHEVSQCLLALQSAL